MLLTADAERLDSGEPAGHTFYGDLLMEGSSYSPLGDEQRASIRSKAVAEYEKAANAGADEALMLDPHGFVATCNSTHFFIVRRGELWTSTGQYCIPGITRGNMIRLAKELDIPVFEKPFSLYDVYGADEAFVTADDREEISGFYWSCLGFRGHGDFLEGWEEGCKCGLALGGMDVSSTRGDETFPPLILEVSPLSRSNRR